MPLLILGSALVYGALLITAVGMEHDYLFSLQRHLLSLALSAFVVPVVSTWLVTEFVNIASPRRLFDRRIHARLQRFTLGLIAGTLGACISALALALLDMSLPDSLLTGASAACAAGIVLVPLSHARRGHCIHCGYDLSGACILAGKAGAVCSECGTDLMRA